MVKIPDTIRKQLELISEGKPLRRSRSKPKPTYSQEELLVKASTNLEFLFRIAYSPLVAHYLKRTERSICIMRWEKGASGDFVLAFKGGRLGLYSWRDADYPADRSDEDFTLITREELKRLGSSKLMADKFKAFALLTQEQIWRNILEDLKSTRRAMA